MKSLICSLLLMACATVAGAQSSLFVRNEPFQGVVRWFPTRTLAPLDELLSALGCSWKVEEDRLRISCPTSGQGGGPTLKEISKIDLEGRPVRLEQQLQQDRVFVDIDQLAEALQCNFRRSPDGKTLDLYSPLLGQGLGAGARKGDSDQPDFPVQLETLKMEPEDGRLRGFVRIKNRGDQVLQKVLVRVAVYEKTGLLLARFAETVDRLEAGQVAAVQFPQVYCDTTQVPVARVEFEIR